MPEYLQRPPIAIVRKLIQTIRIGNRVWDDKMSDGGRSIKVAGWTQKEYDMAVEHLTAEKWNAKLVKTQDGLTRIHVTP